MNSISDRLSGLTGRQSSATSRSLFFSRLWLAGAAIVALTGLLIGSQPLTLLGVLVLVTFLLTAGWNRFALSDLEHERQLSQPRALPGDLVDLTVRVTNRKPLPVPFVTIEEELPESLVPQNRETFRSGPIGRRSMRFETSLKPFERVEWTVPLLCTARGAHTIGPATLRSGDPFAFFGTKDERIDIDELLVYPEIHSLPNLGFPTDHPLGSTRIQRHLITDPLKIMGIRDYRPEDPFRTIHWKATARSTTLQVKQFEPVTSLTLAVFINLETFEHYWEGIDLDEVERAISIGASIVRWGESHGVSTGIYSNGVMSGSDQTLRIPPGLGAPHHDRSMAGLARLWVFSLHPFNRMLETETHRIPWGSTAVIITPSMNSQLAATMESMVARGRRTVLVPIGSWPIPNIPHLMVVRLHHEEEDDGATEAEVA